MLIRQQPGLGRLLLDGGEEAGGHVRGDQAVPILGNNRVTPDGIGQGQAHETGGYSPAVPSKAFAANGVQYLEQQGPQQLFRG